MSARPLVLLTQPYVAAYRVPLFEELRERLATNGVDFVVAAGVPDGDQALRDDARVLPWQADLSVKSIRIGNRRISVRKVHVARRPQVVVTELEALNLYGWLATTTASRVILWGHGKSYVNDPSPVGERLEWALARRAQHVMTYAPGGRNYLIERAALDPSRVTAVGNSTDSEALRRAFVSVPLHRVDSLRNSIAADRVALYVGGLDESKRIRFLIEAAERAHEADPGFRLIVVGKGVLADEVVAASKRTRAIVHIPEARGDDLAELARLALAMWIPGRVGLVAIDSLAVGLPIFTTDFAYHAPEVEFLQTHELRYLPNDPRLFAAEALQALRTVGAGQRHLRDDIPTISSVAGAMAGIVEKVLG
ncbi:glycosyltransferase [Microbacterium sp. NPDC078428]|uniref:glycosyltransferase n=1 Tax=Microbacterium sp. NPDC078428 TaxID=3364190 RepID=UPI0037C8EF9D